MGEIQFNYAKIMKNQSFSKQQNGAFLSEHKVFVSQ